MFFAGGVAYDDNENLLLSDQTKAWNVLTGSTFANCASTPQSGSNDYVMLALSKDNTTMVAANYSQGTVDQFGYASCSGGVGSMNHSYPVGTSSDMVTGAAIDPGTKP
jgi:hypothetical protein